MSAEYQDISSLSPPLLPLFQFSLQEDAEGEGVVAHFPAHATEPVAAMKFDPSGTMLLTCDRLGHNFHLFRIMPHPWSCSLGAVHHLYTLYRGDTTAKVTVMGVQWSMHIKTTPSARKIWS